MSKLAEAKELIRELAELLQQSELSEIEVEEDGLRIRVARQLTVTAQLPPPAPPSGLAAAASPVAEAVPPAAAEAGGDAASPARADASGEEDWLSHPGLVTAPMVGTAYVAPEPGARPFVQVGDTVEEGQTLLIIEAMKVMNPIPAPRAGTVRHIFFSDAQPVEYGEPLLVIA